MRVTDQIDALTTLSTNPMKYLVAPRLLAGTLALPLLVVVADILGVMGGWLIGTQLLGFSSGAYLKATFDFLQAWDVMSGLIKRRCSASSSRDGLLVRLPLQAAARRAWARHAPPPSSASPS
jgi:ABC-type transporter Mla maintaining outer membrane lipid asymmetry permease subunit MlaE